MTLLLLICFYKWLLMILLSLSYKQAQSRKILTKRLYFRGDQRCWKESCPLQREVLTLSFNSEKGLGPPGLVGTLKRIVGQIKLAQFAVA